MQCCALSAPPGCWREVTRQNNLRRAKFTSSLVNNPPVFLGSVIVMTVVMLWLNKTILQTRDNKSIMINSFFGSICALERFILLELEFWPINLLFLIRDLQIGNENDCKQWSDSASWAWSRPAPVMNNKTFSHPHHHFGPGPRPSTLLTRTQIGPVCDFHNELRRPKVSGSEPGLGQGTGDSAWELTRIWLLNYWQ